ncbi:MAG: hypothetical protein L0I62_03125 [Gammaproteobacteria bacterium]|nr:hypothetical protein [Gammaproteobacteria bacterium]
MRTQTRQPVPALVIGGDVTALGVLRSLHLAGIPAYAACPPGDLATRSRWYRPAPGAGGWNGNIGPETASVLHDLRLDRAVLIPCMDDAAIWASDLPGSELGARFPVSSSRRQTLETLQNKDRFAAFLDESDIPHPPTFPLRSEDDIAALPFEDMQRVFLKPVNSQKFNRMVGVKALWADSRAELAKHWSVLQSRGLEVMVQEYVPGPAGNHYFLDGFRDGHGTVTGLLARRRLRIFPPDFGNSSYCESIPLSGVAVAEGHLRELLERLDYRGIFSAEFKRDARDGQFRILEVNIRAWWYVEFAARCGVNVCRMAYDDARGEPVKTVSRHYAAGAGCLYFPGDVKAVFSSNGQKRESWWTILCQWSRSHFLAFLPGDPLPGVFASGASLRQFWLRMIGRRPSENASLPVRLAEREKKRG